MEEKEVNGEMSRSYEDTIVYLDKTPVGIVCPHFYMLPWVFRCPFDCQWCFLLRTGWGKKAFRAYDLNTILGHLARAFPEIEEPQWL